MRKPPRWRKIGRELSRQELLLLIPDEHFCNLQLVLTQAKSPSSSEPGRIELTEAQFEELRLRLRENQLTAEDRAHIEQWLEALTWMGEELEQKKLSIQRLRRLFGVKTESLSNLFPPGAPSENEQPVIHAPESGPPAPDAAAVDKPKSPGHGNR